ncbi:MAG: glycoside hydrolase family 3 protein, partial [Alkalispirochaeta sp.]
MVTAQHRSAASRTHLAIIVAILSICSVQLLGAQSSMVENRSASAVEPSSALFWDIDSDAVGTFQDDVSPELTAHIEEIMAEMSDEERVAQLLMVSWAAEEPTPEVMRWIRERNIGGVKVFGWNGE